MLLPNREPYRVNGRVPSSRFQTRYPVALRPDDDGCLRHDEAVASGEMFRKLRFQMIADTFNWSLSNLVALLRQQLFVYRNLLTWLNDPYQAPPALAGIHDAQLELDFAG